MKESELRSGNNGVGKTQGGWDVETLTEQIFGDLKEVFTQAMIREVLTELLPKYERARIKKYVPILIRREAIEQLHEMQALYPPQSKGLNEAGKIIERRANSDSSSRGIVQVINKIRQLVLVLDTPKGGEVSSGGSNI